MIAALCFFSFVIGALLGIACATVVSINNDYIGYKDLAIKETKTQNPKKPEHDGYDYRCPECMTAVEYECRIKDPSAMSGWNRDAFCSNCGLPIDWIGVEE